MRMRCYHEPMAHLPRDLLINVSEWAGVPISFSALGHRRGRCMPEAQI